MEEGPHKVAQAHKAKGLMAGQGAGWGSHALGMFRGLPTHQGEGGLGMVVHGGAQGGKPSKDPCPLAKPPPPLGLLQANPPNSVKVLVSEPKYGTLNAWGHGCGWRNGVGWGQGGWGGPLGLAPPPRSSHATLGGQAPNGPLGARQGLGQGPACAKPPPLLPWPSHLGAMPPTPLGCQGAGCATWHPMAKPLAKPLGTHVPKLTC